MVEKGVTHWTIHGRIDSKWILINRALEDIGLNTAREISQSACEDVGANRPRSQIRFYVASSLRLETARYADTTTIFVRFPIRRVL